MARHFANRIYSFFAGPDNTGTPLKIPFWHSDWSGKTMVDNSTTDSEVVNGGSLKGSEYTDPKTCEV